MQFEPFASSASDAKYHKPCSESATNVWRDRFSPPSLVGAGKGHLSLFFANLHRRRQAYNRKWLLMSCCWCRWLLLNLVNRSMVQYMDSHPATREVQQVMLQGEVRGIVARFEGWGQFAQSQLLPRSSPNFHSQVDTRTTTACSGAQEKQSIFGACKRLFQRSFGSWEDANICNLTFCCCSLPHHGREGSWPSRRLCFPPHLVLRRSIKWDVDRYSRPLWGLVCVHYGGAGVRWSTTDPGSVEGAEEASWWADLEKDRANFGVVRSWLWWVDGVRVFEV